jgi:hypothetical protein
MKLSLPVLGILSIAACTRDSSQPERYVLREAPPAFADAIARADHAITEVRKQHGSHMNRAMKNDGAPAAIGVCSQEARAITAKLSEQPGLRIGRTSHRLRNPDNQPPPWLASFVKDLDGKRASEIKAQVFDLGTRVGVVRPIPTAKICTKCHGNTSELDPEATGPLRESYPRDRATGFEVGDIRGLFWVEVSKGS